MSLKEPEFCILKFQAINSAMETCHQLKGITFAFRLCHSNIQTSLLHSYPIFVITLAVQFQHFPSQSLFILSFIAHSPLLCIISTVAISVILFPRLNPLIIVPPDWFFVSVYSLHLIVLLLWSSCCPLCFLVFTVEESLKTYKRQ